MDQDSWASRIRVGIFSILGIILIGAVTVFVNDRPFWWKACKPIVLTVEDATGLKTKSPVRSRGLQIGYLEYVELSDTHVRLGICITAPVEVLENTRAQILSEGFLGDRFVEIRPVKYVGKGRGEKSEGSAPSGFLKSIVFPVEAQAQENEVREIPVDKRNEDVQQVVNKVNTLVEEVSSLANSLNKTFNPEGMKETMKKLNLALENASKTLSPEGNLTTTAQRTLAKLEDAIEQLRQIMIRVNQGEGAVGKLLSDPEFAEDVHNAVRGINKFLNKVSGTRLLIDLGAQNVPVYEGSRGYFELSVFPEPTYYYLLGVSVDPAGKLTRTTTTTVVNGVTTTAETTLAEPSGILLTAMLGKIPFQRIDLGAGVLYGDGAVATNFLLGTKYDLERLQLKNQFYVRDDLSGKSQFHSRHYLKLFPSRSKYLRRLYVSGGVNSLRKIDGKMPYFFGGGISFDDEDIKLIFTFL